MNVNSLAWIVSVCGKVVPFIQIVLFLVDVCGLVWRLFDYFWCDKACFGYTGIYRSMITLSCCIISDDGSPRMPRNPSVTIAASKRKTMKAIHSLLKYIKYWRALIFIKTCWTHLQILKSTVIPVVTLYISQILAILACLVPKFIWLYPPSTRNLESSYTISKQNHTAQEDSETVPLFVEPTSCL